MKTPLSLQMQHNRMLTKVHQPRLPMAVELVAWTTDWLAVGVEWQLACAGRKLITNLKQRLARAMAGYNSGKTVSALFGATDSGKTNIVNCMKESFSRYVAQASGSTLHQTKANADPSQFIWLVTPADNDARLFVFNEVGDNGVYDGERIKQLSSGGGDGGDTILIRGLYKMPFEYVPNFTMLLVGNSHPVIVPADTYKRIAAFQMETQFVDADQLAVVANGRPKDATLKGRIRSEPWKAAFTFIILSSFSIDEPPIYPACVIQMQAATTTSTPAIVHQLSLIFEPVVDAFTTNTEIMDAVDAHCKDNDLLEHPLARLGITDVSRMLRAMPGNGAMECVKQRAGPVGARSQHRGLLNCRLK